MQVSLGAACSREVGGRRSVQARLGGVWRGDAGTARRGLVRRGVVRLGVAGKVWRVPVRRGEAGK
jgi:hypothetical protein